MLAVAWPARGINHRFYLPTNFNLRLLQLQCILPSSTFLHLSCRHVHLWGRSARARERTARRGQSPSLRGELARLTEGSVAVLCLGERRWKVSSSVPRRANHEQMSAAASVGANNKPRILDHRRPWARMIKSYPIQGKATHSGSKLKSVSDAACTSARRPWSLRIGTLHLPRRTSGRRRLHDGTDQRERPGA